MMDDDDDDTDTDDTLFPAGNYREWYNNELYPKRSTVLCLIIICFLGAWMMDNSIGSSWGDYDNDGWFDLFVSNNEMVARKGYWLSLSDCHHQHQFRVLWNETTAPSRRTETAILSIA